MIDTAGGVCAVPSVSPASVAVGSSVRHRTSAIRQLKIRFDLPQTEIFP